MRRTGLVLSSIRSAIAPSLCPSSLLLSLHGITIVGSTVGPRKEYTTMQMSLLPTTSHRTTVGPGVCPPTLSLIVDPFTRINLFIRCPNISTLSMTQSPNTLPFINLTSFDIDHASKSCGESICIYRAGPQYLVWIRVIVVVLNNVCFHWLM